MRVLSLFSNIGVAEAYLKSLNVDVVLANELVKRRADLYSSIYPETKMICGDLTDSHIMKEILEESQKLQVDTVMATPPCQGMSTAGQQEENDERNKLICPVVAIVKKLKPKYVFIENVPLFYNTKIKIEDKSVLIPDFIKNELKDSYHIVENVINTQNYGIPQTRERAIILMTRKDVGKIWTVPKKEEKIVTMREAIGDIPPIDPFVKDVTYKELLQMFPHFEERKKKALEISIWNNPPHHIKRQVIVMQHTPSGCSAFDNPVYFPIKSNMEPVKGYHNTYKRQNWDAPAYTVTMDNRKISSQNNVHPGRIEYINSDGETIYSDPRTLTLYELMRIMSLPETWPIPKNVSEAFLRRIIGEGIPPLFVKKVFKEIL